MGTVDTVLRELRLLTPGKNQHIVIDLVTPGRSTGRMRILTRDQAISLTTSAALAKKEEKLLSATVKAVTWDREKAVINAVTE